MGNNHTMTLKLSICIATYNREEFIGETLDTILSQMDPSVELVIVDGASPDNTAEVMAEYLLRYPEIRYFREKENGGVDGDYDKAVDYAKGEYCWLMTDDDLLKPGAINRVLSTLDEHRDLVIVNAEIRNTDLSEVLEKRQLLIANDKSYNKNDTEILFSECMNYLSFIGGVVIRRKFWLERDREPYYGSLFIHVGVIFQAPKIENAYVISDPLILVRYGNGMWTSRGFEIWSFKWPELVWSFPSFSNEAKDKVCHLERWKRLKTLFYNRAIGAYTNNEFNVFVYPKISGISCLSAYFISIFPGVIANIMAVFYFMVFSKTARMMKYDLLRSVYATAVTRWLARHFWA
jgi:glycosyltransferase involved in cell wall biosynthesis|tara:strand:- start:61405 stop:62448 length:1044 start_codon:yes stop_codon:yes gene_type:complete